MRKQLNLVSSIPYLKSNYKFAIFFLTQIPFTSFLTSFLASTIRFFFFPSLTNQKTFFSCNQRRGKEGATRGGSRDGAIGDEQVRADLACGVEERSDVGQEAEGCASERLTEKIEGWNMINIVKMRVLTVKTHLLFRKWC